MRVESARVDEQMTLPITTSCDARRQRDDSEGVAAARVTLDAVRAARLGCAAPCRPRYDERFDARHIGAPSDAPLIRHACYARYCHDDMPDFFAATCHVAAAARLMSLRYATRPPCRHDAASPCHVDDGLPLRH